MSEWKFQEGMLTTQSRHLGMLLDELTASSSEIGEAIHAVIGATTSAARRECLRALGMAWHRAGGEPEVLTELGLAMCEQYGFDAGVALSEMLTAFGAAREEQRAREWEARLMHRIGELNGLHRIISAANSTLDLDSSLETVVETVAEVMGVEACSVYLFDKTSDDLTLRATHGLNSAAVGQVRIRVGEGVTGLAARTGRPIAVADAHADSRFVALPALDEERFRSILAVPILLFSAERFQGDAAKLQGVISVQTCAARDFTDEEIKFVETVAGELAFFIINAQLYQETGNQLEQKLRELQSMQQVTARIAEQLNLEEVLRLIVEQAAELARVDRADILRYTEEGVLELAATYGGGYRDGVMDFIARAVREGRPVAVLNAYTDARFPDLARVAAQEGFHSLFCMPLVARGRTIGAITLYTREARHFDYEQVRLLSMFADETAIAIENARLYDESQRALAVKSAMLQEMHHRVRNNLQTISALLTMQLRRITPGTDGAAALRDSVARIQAIAGVHNLLCRDDIGETTVDAVARQIVNSARNSLVHPERPICFEVRGEPARIGSRDATVLAIVLNELIGNAMTHGLAIEGGAVIVETTQDDHSICVEVRDDGPSHAAREAHGGGSGLGLQIIRTLVLEDLEGSFELFEHDGWMVARLRFPKRMWKE